MIYDKIIIGAGLYGLYAALFCGRRGQKVLVLECDQAAFLRASYINQARVHMGYHYPRSYSTAIKSAGYFERFNRDYAFCIHSQFTQIYATSAAFSWTNAQQFRKFCAAANIRCEDVRPEQYFNDGMCDGAFITTEYAYDAQLLQEYLLEQLKQYPQVELRFSANITDIRQDRHCFSVDLADGSRFAAEFLLNATYASTNQIIAKLGYEPFKIKYELCEIILCKVNSKLRDIGITVMDGPFFSIMPFGKTGLHSLTSVTFTPHRTCFDRLPTFDCQHHSGGNCTPAQLANCNSCTAKPTTAWPYMSHMAKKYLKQDYQFEYVQSLFSMKPILQASEIDDSRPTVIRQFSSAPTFVSVLSGKINTVYDLEEVLTTC